MKSTNKKKEPTKTCYVCNLQIEIKWSRHMHFQIKEGKRLLEDYWCHLECYRNWFNQRQMRAMNEFAENTLSHLSPMIKKLGEPLP